MPYLGRSPTFGQFYTQSITPDGVSSTFSLNYNAPSAPALLVSISGVIQEPYNAYTISTSGDRITFTEVPDVSSSIFITFLGERLSVLNNDTGVTSGTYGNAIFIPSVSVGNDGRIKSASNVAISLVATGVAAATYGSSSSIPSISVGSDGRITSAANVTGNFASTGKAIAMSIVFGG